MLAVLARTRLNLRPAFILPILTQRLCPEQISTNTLAAENNRKQIQGLIEELAATQHEAGSVAQKVGDLYKIVMDSVKLNKDGITPIKAELDRLGALKDKKELYALLGEMQKKGIVSYNVLYVGADEMNSSMNAVQTYQTVSVNTIWKMMRLPLRFVTLSVRTYRRCISWQVSMRLLPKKVWMS